MLKEIVYWVYQFFSNLRQSKKSKDNGRLNSVMFVSICLFINVLTLLNIIEYYTTYDIIEKIPITTKYEFSSWICIIVIMIPFIGLIYKRYLSENKLSNMLQEYAAKSKRRLRWGNFLVFCYCILTWVWFFMTLNL